MLITSHVLPKVNGEINHRNINNTKNEYKLFWLYYLSNYEFKMVAIHVANIHKHTDRESKCVFI
jgi:hypothetical protein